MYEHYTYVLRYQLSALNDNEEKTAALLDFCRKAGIDAVAFISNAEELNTGHATVEETERWLDRAERLAKRLRAAGVAVSLNPWESLLHCDRGRTLKPGQNWGTMVDQNGRAADAQACPADPVFIEYLCDKYARMAARIRPDVFWLDDDMRLHNHAPLHWGGCFCPRHMAMFSEALGRPVSREEFVRGLLAPGEPDECRAVWLSVMGKTMTDLFRYIREAVEAACPGVRMGHMCSDAISHATEGRDYEAICDALTTAAGAPFIRITQSAYMEVSPREYEDWFHYITRYMRAVAPARMKALPELENYPFSAYSKSVRFTRTEIEAAGGYRAAGMTLDLFDGNGVACGDELAAMLTQIKPFLETMRARTENEPERGMAILSDPHSPARVHTKQGLSMTELYSSDRRACDLFAPMGIATRYVLTPDVRGEVVTVFDQYPRSLSDDELKRLFRDNFVILDAAAVDVLSERGLLGLVGATAIEHTGRDNGVYSIERFTDSDRYMTMQCGTGDFSRITYDRTRIRVLTEAADPSGRPLCPATVLVDGHILVIPYLHIEAFFRNYSRELLIKSVLLSEADGYTLPPMLAFPAAHLSMEVFGSKYVITNFLGDDAPVRFLAKSVGAVRSATVYDAEHPGGRIVAVRTADGVTELDYTLRHDETALIELS